MDARPRILIPVPTSFDEGYNQQCWPEYAETIRQAGGEPVSVALTHSEAELEQLVEDADGILLPGSPADVDPARYGHARQPACAEPDPLREQTDMALLAAAERLGTSLLGICMGLQMLNTFYGGTLIQDLDPLPVNHRAGRAVQAAHTALVTPGSRLYGIVAPALDASPEVNGGARLPINSSHHQAVDVPGGGLRVTARCPQDGVIEAVEGDHPDRWLLGLQWHPERTLAGSPASALLFSSFVKAARQRPHRSRASADLLTTY